MTETQFNPMQLLKRSLYAMRNGVVADNLRKAGCPYRLIFGVNLPQINDIAARTGKSAEMAEALWRDTDLRESALMAPMLYPVEELTLEHARRLADNVRWAEDADILCFKLLKYAPFALALSKELCEADRVLTRYTGLRLMFNLVAAHPAEARAAAMAELQRPEPISGLASMLADEASFLMGDDEQ